MVSLVAAAEIGVVMETQFDVEVLLKVSSKFDQPE